MADVTTDLEQAGLITIDQMQFLFTIKDELCITSQADDFVRCESCLRRHCFAEYEACQDDDLCRCIMGCMIGQIDQDLEGCGSQCKLGAGQEGEILFLETMLTCSIETVCPHPDVCPDFQGDE